ncbi:MAG TPA: polymer-forming cytoskeletal protein [Candidatus Limnocylindria bacterium]|jgi:cytoskeletal protein CcmA (bactofilin family)|nr:polymer-forming cytoskeletal protein [Candidatus Limnocylindria bacterium]
MGVDSQQSQSDPSRDAMFGAGSVVEGKLKFEGQVRIDGKFTGEITTHGQLVVGERAQVAANISCGSLVVTGEVTGNIRATDSIELRRPARVKGDIATPSLSIDQGVFFEGLSRMEDGALDAVSFNGGAKKHKTRPGDLRPK